MSKASRIRQGVGGYVQYRKDACEKCGAKDDVTRDADGFLLRRRRILTVHHIDHNHLNNAPNNLQTLCRKCHDKVHEQPPWYHDFI